MKAKSSILTLILFIFSLSNLFLVSFAVAKNVNLYDQPKPDAKVIGTIDTSAGIVPIFTTKEGDWMKVGNPHNGNVGWVKFNDINTSAPTSMIFTQQISPNGKQQTYQIQFGTPHNLNNAQMQQMIQMQQQTIQRAFQDFVNDFKDLYQYEWNRINNRRNLPIVMPVTVIPPNSAQPNPAPQSSTPKPTQPEGTKN